MVTTKNSKPNLYLAKPILKINGVVASPELMKDVLEIVVDESLHMPSMFALKIHNVYVAASEKTEPWKNEKYFKIGDRITIGFESSTTEDSEFLLSEVERRLIEGEITGIEVNFSNTSEAHIVVRGYDRSHRLHRGRYNRSFLNCTDTDIVRRIAREAKIRIGQLDPSGTPHEYVFQENQTNMEFLRERAARIGFELFVQDNKLYFRKPKRGEQLVLEWLEEINSFDVRVTSAEQVSSVQVNGWDYKTKKPISGIASKEQLVTNTGNGFGSSSSAKFKMTPPPKMTVVDRPVNSVAEAKKMAQALCNELGGEFVTADAKATGNPKIRPGKVLSLKNMGTRYSGDYYVTETRHHYIHRNYTTNFTVRGLREGSLLSTLPPKTHLQPGQTFLVGLVTKNKDPKNLGRVKVKFPTLTMEHESQWARVVGLGAADSRGFYCLPEIDDEVLVGFEHGDIHRPYILGGVWNGKDRTVEKVSRTIKNGKVALRTIKTRTGHTIRFADDDVPRTKRGIYIETAGKNAGSNVGKTNRRRPRGHSISMNDTRELIDIKTAGKHSIRMDDRLISKMIEIKTTLGYKVTLDQKKFTISIETPRGQAITLSDLPAPKIAIESKGLVDITAGGAVNVKASGAVGVEALGAVNVTSGALLNVTGGGITTIKSLAPMSLLAPAITLTSPGAIVLTGSVVKFNGAVMSNVTPLP